MQKRQKIILVLAMILTFVSTGLFLPCSTMGAQAPVEKTGQTTSYATGDDGDLEKGVSWPIPRFTDNLNGTVTDNLTGLIWLKKANYNSTAGTTGTAIWIDAVDFCNALASGSCGLTDGSSAGDWRLPNVKELHSLIDFGNYAPALPSGHPFTEVQTDYYWTSTTHNYYTTMAWIARILHGVVYYGSLKTTDTEYVWPVRGDSVGAQAPVEKTGQTTSYATGDDGDLEKGVSWPIPRFTDNLNGTVTDNLTGLIWLKKANYDSTAGTTGTAIWIDAVDFCNALASGSCGLTDGSSAGDWRLPNVKELYSLIDFGNIGPALPAGHPFTEVQTDYYWSSTHLSDVSSAWIVNMFGGPVSYNGESSPYYVLPVRGPLALNAPVPAVSNLGLIILLSLLLGAGYLVMRKRTA